MGWVLQNGLRQLAPQLGQHPLQRLPRQQAQALEGAGLASGASPNSHTLGGQRGPQRAAVPVVGEDAQQRLDGDGPGLLGRQRAGTSPGID